jgi:NifU-like protein involved in Fe-S cluster formation
VENLNKFTHILVGKKVQEAINTREITINMAKTNNNQIKGLNEPPQNLVV